MLVVGVQANSLALACFFLMARVETAGQVSWMKEEHPTFDAGECQVSVPSV
jgi:hypothetical protein